MSKKTVRVAAVALAAVVAATTLAGCSTPGKSASAKPAGPIHYFIPSSWANWVGLKENIAAFEKKTGIKVDVQGIPDEQYDQTLRARLATDGAVDVFAGLDGEKDPSSFMVEIDKPDFKSRMTDSVYASMLASDGKLYSVPTADGLASFGVFYNKDVFKAAGIAAAPTTLDELTADLKAIKTAGKTPLFLSGKDGWTLLQHRNAVDANFVAGNPDIAKDLASNKTTWTQTPGFTEQYTALRGWATSGLTNKDQLTASYEQGLKAVADGTAGAIINGTWVVGALRENNAKGEFGFFALPNPAGSTQVALSKPNTMHIAKGSQNADAARQLLEFLIEPAQVQNNLKANPGIPAFTDVTISDLDPILADVTAYVKDGKAGAHFDNGVGSFPTPQDDIIAAYQELIAGRISVAEFGKKVDTSWNAAGKTAGVAGF